MQDRSNRLKIEGWMIELSVEILRLTDAINAIEADCDFEMLELSTEIMSVADSVAAEDARLGGETCLSCGCQPGDGITEGCGDPDGCGYHDALLPGYFRACREEEAAEEEQQKAAWADEQQAERVRKAELEAGWDPTP